MGKFELAPARESQQGQATIKQCSGKPTGIGSGPDHITRIWAELMKRLGYNNYVAQGGDWSSPVSSAMARLAPAGLLGINAIVPPEIASSVVAKG